MDPYSIEPRSQKLVYEETKSPRVTAIPDEDAESTYMEKLNIQKAKLLLSLTDMEDLPDDTGHKCSPCDIPVTDATLRLCDIVLDEEICEIIDNLPKLEESLTIDTKQSLFHIAGYATRKDTAPSDTEMLRRTTFYASKYGDFTDRLDRGQLNIPHDEACQ